MTEKSTGVLIGWRLGRGRCQAGVGVRSGPGHRESGGAALADLPGCHRVTWGPSVLWRHLQGQSWSAGLCVCTRDRTEPDDRASSWRGGAVGVCSALGVPSSSGHWYPCLTAVRSPPGQGAERRQPLESCVTLLLLQSKERLLYESRRPGFLLPVLELHLNRKKKSYSIYCFVSHFFFSQHYICEIHRRCRVYNISSYGGLPSVSPHSCAWAARL